MMIGLITVAWHGYLAQQIVQMFITDDDRRQPSKQYWSIKQGQ